MRREAKSHRFVVLLILGGLAAFHCAIALPQETGAFSMTAGQFGQLSPPDQRLLLLQMIAHRLQHAKNIEYKSVSTLQKHKWIDGKLGGAALDPIHFRFQHWLLENSYRMDVELSSKQSGSEVPHKFSTGFDAKGSTSLDFEKASEGKSFLRIDNRHSPAIGNNRYIFWLDGDSRREGDVIFRYLLRYGDDFVIVAPFETTKVLLTVPWGPLTKDNQRAGKREFVLHPERGFLPVRGIAEFERTLPDGTLQWRRDDFVVSEVRLVGDVWMPIKLREIQRAVQLGDDAATVWDTEIQDIRHGSVTAQDLHIPIDRGTLVTNVLKGQSYRVDEHAEPITGTVKPLVSRQGARLEIPNRPFWSRPSLILINVGVIAIVLSLFILRRRASINTSNP